MLLDSVLLAVTLAAVAVLFHPRVRRSRQWRATVTPLASIIGSGFLVAAPLLGDAVDGWAAVGMLGVVALAYAIGHVVRLNIRFAEPLLGSPECPRSVLTSEWAAHMALAAAYVVSVTFYLRLLSAFALRALAIRGDFAADVLTTALLIGIGIVGWVRGLHGLESLEEAAVSTKLAIIAALLVGLAAFDASQGLQGFAPSPDFHPDPWRTARVLAGLLLIVQGFETSRYLGDEYDPHTRVRTMRIAQLLSGAIYVSFVLLATPLLPVAAGRTDETAIIDIAARVANVLPALLVVAAVMSQLSAAVADTLGSGGLLSELTRHRLAPRHGYALVVGAALVLLWSASIFEIIALASRAFAFYYLMQCITALGALRAAGDAPRSTAHRVGIALLAGVLAGVVVFAIPAA